MVYEEGTHIAIPWFQRPIIYNVETRPFMATSRCGSRDLQMVDITIRVLTKPKLTADPVAIKIQEAAFTKNIEAAEYEKQQLQRQAKNLGFDINRSSDSNLGFDLLGQPKILTRDQLYELQDLQAQLAQAEIELTRHSRVKELETYDPSRPLLPQVYDKLGTDTEMIRRVMPGIVPEMLREVVARHNAAALINNRKQVCAEVSEKLKYAAAKFHLEVVDVSLTNVSISLEYMYSKAVERKLVAIQELERAKLVLDQAKHEAKSITECQKEKQRLLSFWTRPSR